MITNTSQASPFPSSSLNPRPLNDTESLNPLAESGVRHSDGREIAVRGGGISTWSPDSEFYYLCFTAEHNSILAIFLERVLCGCPQRGIDTTMGTTDLGASVIPLFHIRCLKLSMGNLSDISQFSPLKGFSWSWSQLLMLCLVGTGLLSWYASGPFLHLVPPSRSPVQFTIHTGRKSFQAAFEAVECIELDRS